MPSQTAQKRVSPRPTGDLVDQIGNTPLLDLTEILGDAIPQGVRVLAKAEWFNPGGSVKDRAALSMVQDLERRGRLRPGGVMLDSSSGNTGIALSHDCRGTWIPSRPGTSQERQR